MLYPDCVVHLYRELFGVQPNIIAIEIQFMPSLTSRVTGTVALQIKCLSGMFALNLESTKEKRTHLPWKEFYVSKIKTDWILSWWVIALMREHYAETATVTHLQFISS